LEPVISPKETLGEPSIAEAIPTESSGNEVANAKTIAANTNDRVCVCLLILRIAITIRSADLINIKEKNKIETIIPGIIYLFSFNVEPKTTFIPSIIINIKRERLNTNAQCLICNISRPKKFRVAGDTNGTNCKNIPKTTDMFNHMFEKGFSFQNGCVRVLIENTYISELTPKVAKVIDRENIKLPVDL
jgi:hypothetical protein